MFKKTIMVMAACTAALLGFSGISLGQEEEKRPLTRQQRSLIPISAFTASGEQDKLKTAFKEGLDTGLTVNEIKEAVVQLYAYCGFPRALNSLNTFMETLEERRSAGIKDTEGPAGKPLGADTNKNEYGVKVQTGLAGAAVTGAVYDFAPAIDAFLKEHLFADIFARGVLSHKDRELVTIAALANVDGLNPQLRGHFVMGMNAGLTEDEIRDLISVLGEKVSKDKEDNAGTIFGAVIKTR